MRYQIDIDRARAHRLANALSRGVALKEERIERLKQHADDLEERKWDPDDHGRLWNEKAWRETLKQIADETEDRRVGVDLTVDWRIELKRLGFVKDDNELGEFFERLVAAVAAELAQCGIDGRGADGVAGRPTLPATAQRR